MRKKGSPEDMTVEELRRLLMENRRNSRQERLERYRRTGRVVTLAPEAESSSLESLHSGTLSDQEEISIENPGRKRRKRLFDALLLVVEVAAVLGLFYLIYSGYEALRDLNRQNAEVLRLPTLTPTPLIIAVVLPSGHIPPNSPGGARPNDAEIPEHLRPLVTSLANVAIPTPGPEQAIRIQIPGIGVDAPIVLGDGWEQLKKGVAQHIGSANPGEKSNLVLTAHNDVFGEIFRHLDQLKVGDQVIVYTSQHAYTYVVSKSEIVEPTKVDVMAPTTEAVVTLISCYPYLVDNKRIVVIARLQEGNR